MVVTDYHKKRTIESIQKERTMKFPMRWLCCTSKWSCELRSCGRISTYRSRKKEKYRPSAQERNTGAYLRSALRWSNLTCFWGVRTMSLSCSIQRSAPWSLVRSQRLFRDLFCLVWWALRHRWKGDNCRWDRGKRVPFKGEESAYHASSGQSQMEAALGCVHDQEKSVLRGKQG